MISPKLSRVVLLVRGSQGVVEAANFYHRALGLKLHRVTDDWAELSANSEPGGGGVTLHLQSTYGEGQLSTGYSPVLTFEVTNMDQTIAACAQAGGRKFSQTSLFAFGLPHLRVDRLTRCFFLLSGLH